MRDSLCRQDCWHFTRGTGADVQDCFQNLYEIKLETLLGVQIDFPGILYVGGVTQGSEREGLELRRGLFRIRCETS